MHADGYKAVDLCTHYRFMVQGSGVSGTHHTAQTESSYAVCTECYKAVVFYTQCRPNGGRHECYRYAACTEGYKALVLRMQCSPMVLRNRVVSIC